MHEDINCDICKQSNWTHESTTIISGRVWITCCCGHEQEVFTNKQLDEINRHKEE